MGVQITELFKKKSIDVKELQGKIMAVDSHLFLYQFLTTIRQRDGSLLTDSKGNVTSHLTGLFSRSAKLIENGIKLVYVFDGKPPELKNEERERRKEKKIEAQKRYDEAAQSFRNAIVRQKRQGRDFIEKYRLVTNSSFWTFEPYTRV